jgi:protein gp37
MEIQLPDKLAVLSDVDRRLAEVQTIDEAKSIRDQAEAVRVYARSAKKGLTIQNRAAMVKILAEQRAGNLLKRMELKPGRPKQNGSALKPLGIGKTQSHRWQTMASVPEALVRRREAEATERGEELTSVEIFHAGRKAQAAMPKPEPKPEPTSVALSIEEWKKLSPAKRAEIINAGFAYGDGGLNKQSSDSIEWARWSHNTVTGCLHNCPYCYARDIAERLYPYGFEPRFHPNRLCGPANEKFPQEEETNDSSYGNIFANSISDLFGTWVPTEWIEATLEMARRNPRWRFLTLTKFPQRAQEFEFPDNVWMGTTVDAQARVENAEKAFERIRCKTRWLSIEPLLQPLTFKRLDLFQWVVIGGASGSTQTPPWVPPFDWVVDVHRAARDAGCRIYHKTNLAMGDEVRVREYPWIQPKPKPLPNPFRYLKGL